VQGQGFFIGLARRRQMTSIDEDISQSAENVSNHALVVDLLGGCLRLLVGDLRSLQFTLLPRQIAQIV
jgi:hypothetical protein